jgi:O-antigen/teichoic acid export membrane protein
VKIGSAAAGWGLWCFVFGPLAREVVYAIGVPIAARWWPRWVFRPRELADDFRFGMRANAGELLYQVYSNLDYQVVGYYFGREAVGLYKAAYELVLEPVKFVSGVVTVVAFPAFAKIRGDRPALVAQLVAFTRQNLAVVLITVTADDMLFAVFGKDYVVAAHAGRILAIVGAFRALSFLGPPLLDGMGRSDKSLRYQASAAFILSLSFVIGANLGSSLDAVAIAWAVGYPLAFIVLARIVLEQLGIGAWAFVKPFGRLALIPLVAGVVGLVVRLVLGDTAPLLRLAITGSTIIVVSIAGLVIFEDYSPRAIIKRLRA